MILRICQLLLLMYMHGLLQVVWLIVSYHQTLMLKGPSLWTWWNKSSLNISMLIKYILYYFLYTIQFYSILSFMCNSIRQPGNVLHPSRFFIEIAHSSTLPRAGQVTTRYSWIGQRKSTAFCNVYSTRHADVLHEGTKICNERNY